MIDTHAHLNAKQFDKDRMEIIENLNENGIETLMCIGTNYKDSILALELSQQHAHIFCSLGLSPHDAADLSSKLMDKFHYILSNPRSKNYVRAVGETGLDYHYEIAKKEKQKESFTSMIGLAKKFDLPLIIHCRKAQSDILKILEKHKPHKAVIHCFEGDLEFGRKIIDMDYMISLTAMITYPKNEDLRKAVKELPLENIMIESDCPYLPPQSMRGKRNEPKYIKETAEKLAEIKNLSFEEIEEITSENALNFFFK